MEKNYNNAVNNFFIKEQINPEDVLSLVDCNVHSIKEVNPIANKFGIYKELQDDVISIGDIIGFENDWQSLVEGRPENVFDGLNMLFIEGGNEYQTRALGMLEYSKEEATERLSKSFQDQPIILKSTGEGSYSVAGNGKHRFMLLKSLYLSELSKIKDNPNEIENLKNKYKIPAKVKYLDLNKTYSTYFLMTYGIETIQKIELLDSQSPSDFKNCISVETNQKGIFGSNQTFILNDNDLIKYTKTIIQQNPDILDKEPPREEFKGLYDKKAFEWKQRMALLKQLPAFYKEIKSFREFFDKNMLDIYLGKNIEIGKKLEDE